MITEYSTEGDRSSIQKTHQQKGPRPERNKPSPTAMPQDPYGVCLVNPCFRKRARLSFGFHHERFSGFGAGAPLAS